MTWQPNYTAEEEVSSWNPDYKAEFRRRLKLLSVLRSDSGKLKAFKIHYKNHPIDYFQDWHVTVDPRNSMRKLPTLMPLIMWQQQKDLTEAIVTAIKAPADSFERNLAIVKSRGIGASWIGCHVSDWLYSFWDEVVVGWGSNKAESVDNKNDPNCIFSKIRTIHDYKPDIMMPKGYDRRKHDKIMLLLNPENGSSIVGKAGDEIGRGGRTTVFFNDEKAFYEHAERREAALSENTDHKIDISTHNGNSTLFYRTIKENACPVFYAHWSGDPRKTKKLMQAKKEEYDRKGIPFLYLQEYEMDPDATNDMKVIKGEWVDACIDAHLAIGWDAEGETVAGLDVADEGGDLNALCIRKGNVIIDLQAWGEGDTGKTAVRAFNQARQKKVRRMLYDCIGVGAGAKAKFNELETESDYDIEYEAFNAGAAVVDPYEDFVEDVKNKDMFKNLKAQAWWELRLRCEKTYKVRNGIDVFPSDELISFSSSIPDLHKLKAELSQPTYSLSKIGEIIIDKKPNGTQSPNRADAVMICMSPHETYQKPYY